MIRLVPFAAAVVVTWFASARADESPPVLAHSGKKPTSTPRVSVVGMPLHANKTVDNGCPVWLVAP